MTNIRRYFAKGQMYFLTHVTFERQPILVDNVDLLWKAFNQNGVNDSYRLLAWSILPDHLHLLLDPQEQDVAKLTKRIKLIFSAGFRSRHGLTSGRLRQYRYWDHIIRDQDDLNRHADYIHYNPVKHGLVKDPFDYEHSSMHLFAKEGIYRRGWGRCKDPTTAGEYGE